MERTSFENLRVYQLSEDLADLIWYIATKWDNFNRRDTVGKQIVRSADSIGANIAEGTGRFSFQDNKRFGYIARGSLNETKHWLRRAFKRSLLTSDEIGKIKPIMGELAPKLNAYINSIEKSKRRKSTNNELPTTN